MAVNRMGRLGVVAISLAILGGVLALANEFMRYQRTASLDWGHVALAFGVPALIYVIVHISTVQSYGRHRDGS
jgi:hypothetical protein